MGFRSSSESPGGSWSLLSINFQHHELFEDYILQIVGAGRHHLTQMLWRINPALLEEGIEDPIVAFRLERSWPSLVARIFGTKSLLQTETFLSGPILR